MKAYHGKQSIKDFYIKRFQDHRKADEVIQGTGYDNGRGCAVGCTLNRYDHNAYETELGIPREIALLEDSIFESLPEKKAPQFAEDFLEAIPEGADLSMVIPKFNLWLLKDKKHGVYQYADAQGKKAINGVAKLLRRQISGINVRQASWHAAAAAAAAAWAARAARAAAAWAARAATRAAEAEPDADAAWAARAAAEAEAAAEADAQAEKLLELLAGAPMGSEEHAE